LIEINKSWVSLLRNKFLWSVKIGTLWKPKVKQIR
jgi:hypothetical protein